MARVSVTLDPSDVALLDRLAQLSGTNRSQELRGILSQLRPMLTSTIDAMEQVVRRREQLSEAAARATGAELESLVAEAEKLELAFLGAMSRLEGAAAADAENPRSSNTGVTPPHPDIPDVEE